MERESVAHHDAHLVHAGATEVVPMATLAVSVVSGADVVERETSHTLITVVEPKIVHVSPASSVFQISVLPPSVGW
eukprot:3553744-Prymnesium_polylepis.2